MLLETDKLQIEAGTLSAADPDVYTLPTATACRCRYLSPIGEGVSAQVLLVGDELRPEGPPLVLKVMKRTLAYAGQKVGVFLASLKAQKRAQQPSFHNGLCSLSYVLCN